MKIIKKTYIVLGLIALIIAGILAINIPQNNRLSKTFDSDISLSTLLNDAKEIKIEKKIFSLKKHYYILIDDVVVGEVTGKVFPIFGDKLTMKDVNGNIIKSEYQVKRLGFSEKNGFNISLNRLAEIVDSSDNTTGYIGEEKLKNLFSFNHIQYFYDANKNKNGYAKRDSILFPTKDYTVYNNDGTEAYSIDGNIFSLSNKATITKKDSSNIDIEDVIFYTIIENSIIDYQSASSSNNNSNS